VRLAPGTGTAVGGFCPGIGNFVTATFDATGFRLLRSPKISTSATLNYDRPLGSGKLDASATVYYSSSIKHDVTGTLTQGAYATLSAQAGYRLEDGVRVGVYGRNLTNKAYLQAGITSSGGFVPSYAPPREIGVSLQYTY
jgi:iron complex outermembrane receptor protein